MAVGVCGGPGGRLSRAGAHGALLYPALLRTAPRALAASTRCAAFICSGIAFFTQRSELNQAPINFLPST